MQTIIKKLLLGMVVYLYYLKSLMLLIVLPLNIKIREFKLHIRLK